MGILTRIWEGNFVYQEPICFSEDAEGHIAGGQLLYQPEHICLSHPLTAVSFMKRGQITYGKIPG